VVFGTKMHCFDEIYLKKARTVLKSDDEWQKRLFDKTFLFLIQIWCDRKFKIYSKFFSSLLFDGLKFKKSNAS
jgi:hypothetical protein